MSSPSIPARLDALRAQLAGRGLDAWLVPTPDPHQSEYVPTHWCRREWISGFTGSAGQALIGTEKAWLYTDVRYFLQAASELDAGCYELMRSGQEGVPPLTELLQQELGADQVLGVDSRTVSLNTERELREALAQCGARLELLDENLIDAVWDEQPGLSLNPVMPHATAWAGESASERIARVQAEMREQDCTAHVVTMLDAVAWLFNIRGTDVNFNPVVVAYGIVHAEGATLFVNPEKVNDELKEHLPEEVTLAPYESMGEALDVLAASGGKVLIDPSTCSSWVVDRLARGEAGTTLHETASPITLLKANKNSTEIQGSRDAHIRDGVAMVRFLCWLEELIELGEPLSEIEAAERLALLRSEGDYFRGLSFDTISAFGSHGAIVHYRPGAEGDRLIDQSSLFLLDSGGQYDDGTTDITRTMCYGTPNAEQVDQFTRVLRGHIALAMARFPRGTNGQQLDLHARHALWEVGLNYGHGTGHGVGAYLNVHEGPQSIGPKGKGVPLQPGMILSNEPGFYLEGQHGIRIESLVVVREEPDLGADDKDVWYSFETLTMCPIARKLIDAEALAPQQRAWLNDYHRRVRETLSPLLELTEQEWLENATAEL